MRPANGVADLCIHCNQQVPAGPDLCLGSLANVTEACCGHGWSAMPYVVFADGQRFDARKAIRWFEAAGVGPTPVDSVVVHLFEQHDGRLIVTLEYEYDSLRLVAVRWTNESAFEPVWNFDGTTARLIRPAGVVPLPPGLVCSENPDGTVAYPIGSMETMADGS